MFNLMGLTSEVNMFMGESVDEFVHGLDISLIVLSTVKW